MSEPMQLLDYIKAKKLLEEYGIHSIDSSYVSDARQAIGFSRGRPIVMKVLSEKELHKSKAGLVRLNLTTPKDITDAYNDLHKKAERIKPYKIIVQAMSEPGNEIIIGGRTDPQFGKVILIGLGGIYVEVFRDFALRVAPLSKYDIEDMLAQLKSRKIITHDGIHTRLIEDLIRKVAKLMQDNDSINELDLNPVIITDKGYQIVDIRILK